MHSFARSQSHGRVPSDELPAPGRPGSRDIVSGVAPSFVSRQAGIASGRRCRRWLTVALLAAGAPAAYAQDAAPAPVATPTTPSVTPAQAEAADAPQTVAAPELASPGTGGADIVVTGSRITRTGYDTPTPVTVIGTAEIQASAPANLSDFVNQIPSVAGSVAPSNSQRSLSNGTAGVNNINLRNLGTNRTLVLLDGRRSVGSTADTTVDINTIPQGLVKNIEVVTGGASSVYGSDAVAGVVNFILDKTFVGLKGEASYGLTQYDDDKTRRATLTGGLSFGGGRGHVIVSGQYIERDGVKGAGTRAWAANGMHLTQNPSYVAGNGQPELLASTESGLNTTTGGGIITAVGARGDSTLRGVYFGAGGNIARYNYGRNYTSNSSWTIGGDWQASQQYYKTDIQPEEHVRGIFGRASYEVADWFEPFVELSYNTSRAINQGGYETDKANVPIAGDNAYLINTLVAGGLCGTRTTVCSNAPNGVTVGTWNADIPTRLSDNYRRVQRYVAGGSGKFGLLGQDWKWDGYYQHGVAKAHETVYSAQRIKQAYSQDAVFNAAGQIVCRVTVTGSTDPLAAGCQPFNRLGIYGPTTGQVAGLNYFMGLPTRDERLQQDVEALNFSSNITNPWLKPIGIAFGAEHRREAISGYADPYSQANWVSGNFLATNGHYTVTEAYLETLVPLPFGFEFNGAGRYTSYSQSGSVETWKAGLTWEPIRGLRFRATRSRDIRAPNLTELFQAGSRNTNSLGDPFNNRVTTRYTQSVGGNLDLNPEKADTLGLGAVYQPSFLPGFGISVDYYDIKIKGAIGQLSSQQTIDRCFTGNADLCSRLQAILRNADGSTSTVGVTTAGPSKPTTSVVTEYLVAITPYNFLQDRARGLDFEVSYHFRPGDLIGGVPGTVNLRGIATRYLENSESNGIDAPTDTVGQNAGSGPPKWTYRATAGWDIDRLSIEFTGRGLSAGVYNNQWIECQANCPATGTIVRTIYDNKIHGAFYLDAYFAYRLPVGRLDTQLYFRVANLLNKDPARVGKGPSDNSNVDTGINQTLYDYLGRRFTMGLRFNFGH